MWQNWSGNVQARPQHQAAIADAAALADLIRDFDGPIRVAGAGHSFSPLLSGEGALVTLDGLCDVAVDPAGGIRAGTGIVLHDLTARMHDLGHALANMGDVDGQRLGGALATGTHGTGVAFQTYSAMIREMALIDGQGALHRISRDSDADLYRAMAVSLGTGGIVTEATLATIAPYRLARRRFATPLEQLLAEFDAVMGAARNVDLYYVPHSGAVLAMESALATGPGAPRPPDRDQEGLRQLRLAARLLGRFPRIRRWLMNKLLLGHTTEHFTEDWHKAYPTERDAMRFNETEWHIPQAAGPAALHEIVTMVERDFPEVFFPMEIRLTGGDDLYLSPFQGGPRVSIAVHHIAGAPFAPLMRAVQDIAMRYEGRPHWGKAHGLRAADLRALYPDWDIAIEARRTLDPKGRFVTPYIAELLGL